MIDWMPHVARLADQLSETGELRTAPWHQAVRSVPRHQLVPAFDEQTEDGRWTIVEGADLQRHARWLEAVYSDTTW